MRLSKIKLAGFKSFVDPTTIYLPSNLVGVVGPNGCGKSNVIDAIRWVMGETSARNLRGDSMDDVIFNGSGSRKPVGSASIELFFDNSDGTIGGQFASYAEICIRRMVSRDDTSQYFLNNTRCRRKDITNLFLGTGLGPRSYAIIEQGMVSRLVDAKPEEMRTYIEEAAGISKYKERRRETENRMQHTRDNLARLNDLREEVEKQIKHLQRQAQVAERYKGLKRQERQLEAELLAIRLAEIDTNLGQQRGELGDRQTAMDAALAGQRQVEAEIERARARHVEASDAFSVTQASYYSVQSDISRLEQTLAHTRELRQRQMQDLQSAELQLAEIDAEIERDEARLRQLEESLSGFEPRLAGAREAQATSTGELQRIEQSLHAWQDDWHVFNLDVKEQQQARQLENTRLEHLGAHGERLGRQLDSVEGERRSISVVDLEARLAAQVRIEEEAAGVLRSETDNLDGVVRSLGGHRDDEQRFGADIEHLRGEIESRRGRLETLRAIEQAALGSDEEVLSGWLEKRGLASSPRLVQGLSVPGEWARAVETVLGDFLQAVCVDHADTYAAGLPDASVVLLDTADPADIPVAPGTLAAQVGNAGRVQGLLAAVRCAGSLDEALALRERLAPGHSVITADGIWLGPGWVRVSRGQRYTGAIARVQEIRELAETMAALEVRMTDVGRARTEARLQIEFLETQRIEIQDRIAEANRQCLDSGVVLSSLRQDLERARHRLVALGNDSETVRGEIASVGIVIDEARRRLAAAELALAGLEERRPGFREKQEILLLEYNAARERAEQDRSAVAQIMVEFESRRAAREAAGTALERIASQRLQLLERAGMLRSQILESEAPIGQFQQELDVHLALQVDVQQQLATRREELEAVEVAVRTDEGRRLEFEKQVSGQRDAVDVLRMQVRELEVRRESLIERFAVTGLALEEVASQVPQEVVAEEWDRRLGQVRASIERLGPINLAAIDEFSEQSERKTYLDAQYQDLSSALDTLEHAIRKIDRETRTRFQETFDNVNNGLKRIFPRLFGGGHAYLTLEGEDLLNAGVTVMARPPGKRNSHIHLLSGGEKALTAVALIFSIFELNPAPFCLLDEVDAPLDEANVGRFCDIVREMSKTVQFVVITHNKTTMEMASQLTGVTMNEPGVSRLVAVDIDEAVKLVAS